MLNASSERVPTSADCDAAVATLIERHAWQLLEHSEFSRRVRERLASTSSTDATRAAFWVYSETLYTACSGSQGEGRREQGYTELSHWLYDVAVSRYRNVAVDATQQALLSTYEGFGRCRLPGAFLMFALIQLRDAARRFRKLETRELSSAALVDDEASFVDRIADDDPSPELLAFQAELREQLARCRVHFLQKYPRSAAQFDAIWLKFIVGLDDNQIAQRLGKSVADVHVLRTRCKKKLKQEPEWSKLMTDLDIMAGAA